MIARIIGGILIGGMVLFFLLALTMALSGVTWGINGALLTVGACIALGGVGFALLAWILGAVEGLMIRFALMWQALRRIRAETAAQEMAADFFQVIHPTAGAIAVDRAGRMIRLQPPVGQPQGGQSQKTDGAVEAEYLESGPRLTALDLCIDAERAMVCGGTRSGKTFFCKQLAYHRMQRGDKVYAIDPKDFDPSDPWPDGVRVIGESDRFDEMAAFWSWLKEEKARRGRNMANICREPFLLIFFDEINDCLFERPDFADHYIRVLRKFAQYRIGIFCIGQSDDVASVGLKGLVQLKQCFDLRLLFEHDKIDNIRRSYARLPNRPEMELSPYQPVAFSFAGGSSGQGYKASYNYNATTDENCHAGHKRPFSGHCNDVGCNMVGYTPGAEQYVYEEARREIFEASDSRTATIIKMYRAGCTVAEICRKVLGAAGGNQSKKVKAVLAQYGLI